MKQLFLVTLWGVLAILLFGCTANPMVNETWRLAEIVTRGSNRQRVSEVIDVHYCVEPEIDSHTSCSAGTESSLSVDLGIGVSVKLVDVGIDVQGQLGIGKESGASMALDPPSTKGYVYRYHVDKTYTVSTGKGVFVSMNGERREGDYVFEASCTVTHSQPKEVLTCEEAMQRPPEVVNYESIPKGAGNTSKAPLFQEILTQLYNKGEGIRSISYLDQDHWAVLIGERGYWANGPQDMLNAMNEIYQRGVPVKQVVFGAEDSWLILYGRNGVYRQGVPEELASKLHELNQQNLSIEDITLLADGYWLIMYESNQFYGYGMPTRVKDVLQNILSRGSTIKQVAIGEPGYWVILYDRSKSWYRQIPDGLVDALAELEDQQADIRRVVLTMNGGWIVLYGNGSWKSSGIR